MSLVIYLNFNTNAEEAINFYSNVFKTESPEFMYFKDMPPSEEFPLLEEHKNLVMHGSIKINDTKIMFSDTLPDTGYKQGNNINILIQSNNEEEIRNQFAAFEKNGTILMPLQETFFCKCFGSLEDEYGIGWQFYFVEE